MQLKNWVFLMGLLCAVLCPNASFAHDPPEVAAYPDLLKALQTVEPAKDPKDKVREIWTQGHLMEAHAAEHRLWAEYDAELNQKLAEDLKQPLDQIRRIRRFARTYPKRPLQKLDWWHYQAIMDIPDEQLRDQIAARDEKEQWTSKRLQAELKPFRIKNRVAKPAEPHRYNAVVSEVIDGDTFNAAVDLGFGMTTMQKFRLAGLDAPELPSSEGHAAKVFFVEQLSAVQGHVILQITGQDKYDRYLAKVWVEGESESVNEKIIARGLAKAG